MIQKYKSRKHKKHNFGTLKDYLMSMIHNIVRDETDISYRMLTDNPEFQALSKLPRDPNYPNGNIDDINSYRIWFVNGIEPGALFMPYCPLRKDVIQIMFDNISLGTYQCVHFRYMGPNKRVLSDFEERKKVLKKLFEDFAYFCELSGVGVKDRDYWILGRQSNNLNNAHLFFKDLDKDGIIELYSML